MSHIVVETTYGKVRGKASGAIWEWKGIPYAQPPVRELRFRPPQPLQAWAEMREASEFGPTAPQDIPHLGNLMEALQSGERAATNSSEDCLYLNVWSPAADDKKRPVMVWIHGGAFVVGAGSQPDYNGAGLAEQGDIVIVTLNYRLGVLGFLHLAELAGPQYQQAGNCGLLDQIAALQWVQANIAAFGGDPNNVTIFGESAGAMSIGMLLAMPAASGLFQRAILESGAAHSVQSSTDATSFARAFLEQLHIEPGAESQLDDIPLASIIAAQTHLLSLTPLSSIRPVIDGISIPQKPIEALAAGAARNIAILIGTNRDEIKLFMAQSSDAPADPALAQRILGERTIEVFTTYAMARPGEDMREIGFDMFTDYTFRIPAIRLAEQQVSQGASVWMYRFDWPSPNQRFGACHGLEMAFIWNAFQTSPFRALLGENPPQSLATGMQRAWIAFARSGNPNTPELPPWPEYTHEQRATLILNQESRVVHDPQGQERAVWQELL